jgi:DNA-binding MarR family transcriptional regulator
VDASDWRKDDLVGVWSGLLRLYAQLVPVIEADLQRTTGMPLGWYDVMLELSAAPDRRMRMLDLGEAAVLSRTRVSRVVDELEREGYVTRLANPDDRRSAFAQLTSAGRAAFRKAAPLYLDSIRQHLGARLSAREARALRALLEQALGP